MTSSDVPPAITEYLSAIEGDRGEAVRAVFDTVQAAMPEGYELAEWRGAPVWEIPLATFPKTYNGNPLSYVALMAQKNYNSLYLMGLFSDPQSSDEFREAWTGSGLKLNMGKSCLRFKTLADVNLDLIAETVASITVERYLDTYVRNKERLSPH
jgi:hypothetical protein